MLRHRQHGASGLMIAVVLVLLVVALLASRVLTRLGEAADDKNNTIASLNRAQTALDQYVAAGGANARLPCPADPSADTGVEMPASAKTCTFTAGTLPWATIGLRRDDAYDAWGRKLSYRVYTDNGNKGSLVQPGGPSLVNCYPDSAAGGGTDSNGLCNTSHTTSTFDVLKKKGGLDLTDFGTDHKSSNDDPTAYVVISHGPTGLGGYSASGVQVVTESHLGPGGDEKDNTKDTGPFHIEAWSDPDTAASANAHFDDLLVYRTVADLAQKAGLQARGWGLASLTFDASTITLGGGSTPMGGGDAGTTTLTYATANGTVTIQGFQGTTATDVSYDTTNGNTGIGVYGGGSGTLISSAGTGESMYIKLGTTARQFAITLNDFVSYFGGALPEQVQLTFYKGNSPTPVYQVQKSACSTNAATLSTFSVLSPADFDRVDVRPEPITIGSFIVGDSNFSISAVSACRNGVSCTTAIATSGMLCP